MDAPLYPPATSFVQPERVAYRISTRNTPIAELMKIPSAWAIITEEVPNIDARLSVPMLKPHLGNFSLRSLVQFGFAKPEQLDRADARLLQLGDIK
ncbi:MAG: hypothetical protein ABIM50_02520 [Novosphingobium sp.]